MIPKPKLKNKSRKFPVIACGVAIIRRGREFLIAQRNPQDTLGSFWEFPGGKRMAGETFEACVAREAKEELGIEIRVDQKLMAVRKKYGTRVIWLNFFLCTHMAGNPKPLDCQKVEWADLDDLSGYKFPPANERVIETLVRNFGMGVSR